MKLKKKIIQIVLPHIEAETGLSRANRRKIEASAIEVFKSSRQPIATLVVGGKGCREAGAAFNENQSTQTLWDGPDVRQVNPVAFKRVICKAARNFKGSILIVSSENEPILEEHAFKIEPLSSRNGVDLEIVNLSTGCCATYCSRSLK